MNLHNLVNGVQTTAEAALAMLGIDKASVPRFRDAYFTWANETTRDPLIVIYTRTGGGYREDYHEAHLKLKELPGFKSDEDDSFDDTYAYFYFGVPGAALEEVRSYLDREGAPSSPTERVLSLRDSLNGG